ncbi:IS66 family insertion sequence element accessory protein TnpB [Serratia plymuthica]|uniref:IS66 family insertion sequence element accessory protein TnpB n=1 Tax=Serratia plymuthica TaxID=82996 RepID=UPI0018D87115|nr:IS66 family insertion sequence element accessory protein TnpB [Serratia plymuthica]CAI1527753.1 IS66 Orf2 like protein [Serratia plymuthica]
MMGLPTGTRIWIVAGMTDMRNGFHGLAAKVQTALKDDPLRPRLHPHVTGLKT